MSEPTKEELLAFMRKHGPENVYSITDTESAIRHFRCTSKIYKEQRDQYKTERDTLIDDIAVLKANNDRCRNRAENAMELAESANCEVLRLERANAELMVARDKYTILTNHIRLKAENNPGVDRYIALVNYIDRLERD
ncbi:hypothetical protein NGH74_08515 [Staphylococcus pseudoxylosus]|uniref:hypothetical protein n=1 Tax=Staphylococcus pseudoxylosus TaxID=2282419 RepID=UPI002DBF7E4A|nr:hypothetical protein [Staphylococcus pseudoxylosus]MEB8087216.1 hypothetical protein [Staphylococcus pseudoxylosus]